MGKRDKTDSLSILREWQEHQYNPGYWINRYSLGFPPKRSKGMWIFALIDAIMIIPAFFLFLWLYIKDRNAFPPILLFLYGGLSLLSYLRVKRLKPLHNIESAHKKHTNNNDRRKKKKKLPKRRKDYR